MANFRANYTNKVDLKGRVSVPASFRSVLGEGGFEIFCMPSFSDPAIEVYTQGRLDEITEKFERDLDPMSLEYRRHNLVMNGDMFPITIDSDGRIILPEDLRRHARIGEQATFVGAGKHFEIWEPVTYQAARADARRAMQKRHGGLSSGKID